MSESVDKPQGKKKKSSAQFVVQTWSLPKEKVSSAPVNTSSHSTSPVLTPPPSGLASQSAKRGKACFHCRQSKVKCINERKYTNPCQRCVKQNLECYYEYKISNYKNVNEAVPRDEPKISAIGGIENPTSVMANDGMRGIAGREIAKRERQEYEEGIAGRADSSNSKRLRIGNTLEKLSDLIRLEQVFESFQFFQQNFVAQLYGLTLLDDVDIVSLYDTNALLAIVVVYICSTHDLKLALYTSALKHLMDSQIARVVIVRNDPPKNDADSFQLILALALAGFWLNQNLTGVAIQLAKQSGVSLSRYSSHDSACQKRFQRLWYLLYLLDGQQALAYNREPLIMNEDPHIIEFKQSLLSSNQSVARLQQDIHLVSQIEYNAITNEIFQGKAWNILDPAKFGIPYKTNLDLDKWMVHWTVLLGSMRGFQSNAWSSKSTMLYYNFAKMHVNSKFIREQMGKNETFPSWKGSVGSPDPRKVEELDEGDDGAIDGYDDDDDQDQIVSSRTEEDPVMSSKLATASALNILQLILFDGDVAGSLRYCPTHVHVLLYYAVLLSLNSPFIFTEGYSNFLKLIKLLKSLLRLLSVNLPVNRNFGLKLIFNLKKLVIDKIKEVLEESSGLTPDLRERLMEESKTLSSNSHINVDSDSDEMGQDDAINDIYWTHNRQNKTISAWPGTDHSHPVVNNTKIIDFSS